MSGKLTFGRTTEGEQIEFWTWDTPSDWRSYQRKVHVRATVFSDGSARTANGYCTYGTDYSQVRTQEQAIVLAGNAAKSGVES